MHVRVDVPRAAAFSGLSFLFDMFLNDCNPSI